MDRLVHSERINALCLSTEMEKLHNFIAVFLFFFFYGKIRRGSIKQSKYQ